MLVGSWYSGEEVELRRQLTDWIERVRSTGSEVYDGQKRENLRALIAPHAGYDYSGPTAAYAYAAIDPTRYKRVFVLVLSTILPPFRRCVYLVVRCLEGGGILTVISASLVSLRWVFDFFPRFFLFCFGKPFLYGMRVCAFSFRVPRIITT